MGDWACTTPAFDSRLPPLQTQIPMIRFSSRSLRLGFRRHCLFAGLILAGGLVCGLLHQTAFAEEAAASGQKVPFARDILPILSANCYACHGPDESQRQGGLRLDIEADAKGGGEGVIVPGNPQTSQLLARITSNDPDEVMPPPDFNRQLEPEQIERIRQWIADGAEWEQHWAFQPLREPTGTLDDWVRHRLQTKNLSLQPAASPHNLARRLSLDLLGVPPTPEQADAFAADPSPEAYEAMVDRLLGQPQFGEHWARMWLDLARYADTKGYEKDRGRTMWPYRDWVIKAFNTDMPLDRFTTEQLAGDLLPEPTTEQIVATAFHRNTMSNDEGGTDDEEFRTLAVKDRINTTVQVWMGLTMGCAQCHTHKYDPISIEDYYRFFAIFNQTEDADRGNDAPRMEVATPGQMASRIAFRKQLTDLQQRLQAAEEAAAISESETNPWRAAEVTAAKSSAGTTLQVDDQQVITASGKSPESDTYELTCELAAGRHTALRLEAIPVDNGKGTGELGRNPADPNFVVSEFTVRPDSRDDAEDAEPWALKQARADFAQDGWPAAGAIDGDSKTGWAISPRKSERHVILFDFAEPLQWEQPRRVRVTITQAYGNRLTLARFRVSISGDDVTTLAPESDSPECRELREQIADTQQQIKALNDQLVQLPIMRELPANKQRQTRLHRRGNFLDPGEPVAPAVLSAFHPLPESVPANRLGVAQWLVSDANPLTPRVWANRVWARLFGRGLVETEEDFGALGAPPSHPELLDWLAAEYRNGGWSLKTLLKTIVMSETYRQSSHLNAATLEADPDNRWFSRAPRFRLTGEALRDQALSVSGLLSAKMGGPPVMPPQPTGLWRSTYSGEQWIDAEGEDRFRRGLYTYLKRTTPYPSFTTFDGGSGEVCLIRRVRTNTPLQALITMNDPVFLEAATALAGRMIEEAAAETPTARAQRGMRLALIRPLRDGELEPLLRLQHDTLVRFQSDPKAALQLIAAGRGDPNAPPSKVSPAEWASWIMVATSILNLDEYLTRN